jgi:hypothetical protein
MLEQTKATASRETKVRFIAAEHSTSIWAGCRSRSSTGAADSRKCSSCRSSCLASAESAAAFHPSGRNCWPRPSRRPPASAAPLWSTATSETIARPQRPPRSSQPPAAHPCAPAITKIHQKLYIAHFYCKK